MNALHIVAHSEKSSRLLYDKLSRKHSVKFVSYRHEPDEGCSREHFHALLEGYEGTRETLRNYIKEIFNVGRGSFFTANTYSKDKMEVPIDYGLITYMSKGVKQPEINEGFECNLIEEFKTKWVEPVKKTVNLHSVEVNYVDPTPKKYTKWDYIKMAVTQCVEKQALDVNGQISFNEVFDIYKKILIEYSQKTGKYKMADDIFTIMLQLGNCDNHMRNQVAKVLGFMS